MVVTVEPGIYFIDAFIEAALASPTQSPFLVPEVIKQYHPIGGIRIEDVVLVTDSGVSNLTKACKTIAAIEALTKGPGSTPNPI